MPFTIWIKPVSISRKPYNWGDKDPYVEISSHNGYGSDEYPDGTLYCTFLDSFTQESNKYSPS